MGDDDEEQDDGNRGAEGARTFKEADHEEDRAAGKGGRHGRRFCRTEKRAVRRVSDRQKAGTVSCVWQHRAW